MRLINADALIEEIHSYTMYDEISKYDIERAIDDAPTVDAEPVRHGRWEFMNDYTGRCSVCKEEVDIDHLNEPMYCEKCGAKMDEEVE